MDTLINIWQSMVGLLGSAGASAGAGGVLNANARTMDMAQLLALARHGA